MKDKRRFEIEKKEMDDVSAMALLMRKKRIVKLLEKANAVNAESAKTFEEIGILHPNAAPIITEILLRDNVIAVTKDGRYYLV